MIDDEDDRLDRAWERGYYSDADEGADLDMDEAERVAFYQGKEDRAAYQADAALDAGRD